MFHISAMCSGESVQSFVLHTGSTGRILDRHGTCRLGENAVSQTNSKRKREELGGENLQVVLPMEATYSCEKKIRSSAYVQPNELENNRCSRGQII